MVISGLDNGFRLSKLLIPKEIFIAAYNQWIKGDDYDQR